MVLMVGEDVLYVRSPDLPDQRRLSTHVGRMGGGYLGLVTAVVVVNVSKPFTGAGYPQFILWLGPAVVGIGIILIAIQRINRGTIRIAGDQTRQTQST